MLGKTLIHFPRVADKLVMMAVEIHIARQITHFCRTRQVTMAGPLRPRSGHGEALPAPAARTAWAAADNALQIHGGNVDLRS